jgi:hypothetical protein
MRLHTPLDPWLWVPRSASDPPQWIAKQQLARQGTKCFWREPVGQQKSAQRHKGINMPFCGVPAGTEDDRLSDSQFQRPIHVAAPGSLMLMLAADDCARRARGADPTMWPARLLLAD